MRRPIRFRSFVGAYFLTVFVLVTAPALTVEGGGLVVEVRPGASAPSLDLAFDGNYTTRDDGRFSEVQRRTSAESRRDDETGRAPVQVSIDRLGIEGPVVAVGIAPDRQLDVPFSRTAGWYRHSSLPMGSGASVIAAHVDFDGRRGLFFDLRLTVVGDIVKLTQPDGTEHLYEVTAVALYDKSELPADELFRSGGEHALHLVTCGGQFDQLAGSYRGNQVVTARPMQ